MIPGLADVDVRTTDLERWSLPTPALARSTASAWMRVRGST